jgi:UPF0755 protein
MARLFVRLAFLFVILSTTNLAAPSQDKLFSKGEKSIVVTDQFSFRILEGWRIEEIAATIDDNPNFTFSGEDFLVVVGPGSQDNSDFPTQVGLPAGASLEGFLFPDTYQLPSDITPESLRDLLLQHFTEQIGSRMRLDAAEQGQSLYEVVTLASIIERESIFADEQPLIASVYRNRLKAGIKLDAESTVQYALGKPGNWWPRLTADNYNIASPYNTFRNDGLPPGPISNPSLSAIVASLYPAQSNSVNHGLR